MSFLIGEKWIEQIEAHRLRGREMVEVRVQRNRTVTKEPPEFISIRLQDVQVLITERENVWVPLPAAPPDSIIVYAEG